MNKNITISILGCGWLGKELGKFLKEQGFIVKGSVRHQEKMKDLADNGILPYYLDFNPEPSKENQNDFFNADVLIISIPPGRSTGTENEFPLKINSIIKLVEQYAIERVIFISSTSVYPDDNKIVNEFTQPEPVTISGLALYESEEILESQDNFITTVIRFGGLMGNDRNPENILRKRHKLGHPESVMNLIFIADCIQIIYEVIKQEKWGYTFNAVSDYHPKRKDFYRQAIENLRIDHEVFDSTAELNYKIVDNSYLKSELDYEFTEPSKNILL